MDSLDAASRPRYGPAAWGLALIIAVLWTVHPLQTQSVTYLYQRFESLMGLFYLLTLFCFIRAQRSSRARWWYASSAACCLLAVGTKEIAITAPLVILWYDRAYVAGSCREIWQTRRWYYLTFVAAFGLLTVIMATHWSFYPGGGVIVVKNLSAWEYARSQSGVILHYLRLCFWPQGQCIDYGWPVARTTIDLVPPLLVVALLIGATGWCVFRRPEAGFLGAWFFLILAPTSSVVPIRDLAFEHRMYLPLAAVIVAAVVGTYSIFERLPFVRRLPAKRRLRLQLACAAAVVAVLGHATYARNQIYASHVALWTDVVSKSPDNARGHYNLAHALETEGNRRAARYHYERAVALAPDDATAHTNLGNLLAETEPETAIAHYGLALAINPQLAEVHDNLAGVLARCGRREETILHCRKALEISPAYAPAHIHLGDLLASSEPDAALAHYRKALSLNPESAEAHNNLATLLATRQPALAVQHCRLALRIQPSYAEAHYNLANLLVQQGRVTEAIVQLRETLRLRPDWEQAAKNLAILCDSLRQDPARAENKPGSP